MLGKDHALLNRIRGIWKEQLAIAGESTEWANRGLEAKPWCFVSVFMLRRSPGKEIRQMEPKGFELYELRGICQREEQGAGNKDDRGAKRAYGALS